MQTVRRIRDRVLTPKSSLANTRTGSSRAVSGTTCRRKPPKPLPKRSSTSPEDDRQDCSQRVDLRATGGQRFRLAAVTQMYGWPRECNEDVNKLAVNGLASMYPSFGWCIVSGP